MVVTNTMLPIFSNALWGQDKAERTLWMSLHERLMETRSTCSEGVGSLFIVYALGAELVQSIPYVFQSSKYSSVQQPHQPSPASSMDEKMKESY